MGCVHHSKRCGERWGKIIGRLEDCQSEDELCAETANQKPGIGSKRQMNYGDRKVGKLVSIGNATWHITDILTSEEKTGRGESCRKLFSL